MLALIDGDVLSHRTGFSCESWVLDEQGNKVKAILPVEVAYSRLNEMIENVLNELGTEDYKIFLTDSDGNFRKKVDAGYKANRKDVVRPIHLEALENFLIQSWGAIRAIEEEADDRLGIEQTTIWSLGRPCSISCIVTIDKDLNCIPGTHYNFVNKELFEISEEEAQYFFYKQLLMGDATDNIKGVPGIGAKKAEKYLTPYFGNEEKLFEEVYFHYKEAYPDLEPKELDKLITTMGQLVWIRQKEGEMWQIPVF